MGKKARKSSSSEENHPIKVTEKTITLDTTCDTDIIECSVLDESQGGFSKKGRISFRKPTADTQSPKTPMRNKELENVCISLKSSKRALRMSLRRSYGLEDDEGSGKASVVSYQTPRQEKNARVSNSAVKKIISTLKKSPGGPYLSMSKLRNIEQWLNENEVETVRTPPFANLSVTPRNSLKKRLSARWNEENVKPEESSIDSEVEGVLKAVYGEDWQRKARTEPKKKSKRFFSPVSQTKRRRDKAFRSVRRNILSEKKLDLGEKSDSEKNLDDSFVSGIRMINLDGSSCKEENIKRNVIKSGRKKGKHKVADSSFESPSPSPGTKRPKEPLGSLENKGTLKSSSCKKIPPDAASRSSKKTFLASLSVSTPTSKCHPDAQYYKINFKTKKEELVKKLYKLYNSEIFDCKLAEDMNFSWNVKLRGTAGYCFNKRVTKSTGEVIRQSRIEFSTKIVDRADRLRDTMIHELCHAASWVVDGVLDGHGEVWGKWASRAAARFPELPPIKRCHNYDIVSKYVYRCTGCGYSVKRHSKSINTERKRCGHCYGVLELLINRKRKGKGEVPEFDTTRTLPTPNKFAMFVKENYHSVKSTKSDAKHSEIMKILSREYAILKSGRKSAKTSHQ